MASSLEDVGKSPGGDAAVSFLRVSHNDDGTLKSGATTPNLDAVLGVGNDAGGQKITNVAAPTVASDVANKSYVDGAGGGGGGLGLLTWSVPGTLTVQNGVSQTPIPTGATIAGVLIRAATAPTGSSIIVDVNKNGSTIYTTVGNRPTIAVSTNVSSLAVPDIGTLSAGDYITVDIDQVGSTIAGSDLVVVLQFA